MRSKLSLYLVFPILSCAALEAAWVEAPSKVEAVTVFPAGASITRRTEPVTLPAGTNEVVLTDLPWQVDEDSLLVDGRGVAGTVITDVRLEATPQKKDTDTRVAKLHEALKKLEADVRATEDRRLIVIQQQEFIKKLGTERAKDAADKVATQPVKLEELQATLSFIGENMGKLSKELQGLDETLERLKREVGHTKAALANADKPELGPKKQVVITVETPAGATSTGAFTVRYMVPDWLAGWSPSYEARVTPDKSGALNLRYEGIVRQKTGEDWTKVALTLSTAFPQRGGDAPELQRWSLSEAVVRSDYGLPPKAGGRAGSAKMVEEFREMPAPAADNEMGRTGANVTAGLTSTAFVIPGASSVPSDGSPHKLAIGETPLEVELYRLCVPKLRTVAFLQGKIKNKSETPLLPGEVKVFSDGVYTTRSTIKDVVMPGGTFELSLGVDEGIVVTRKPAQRLVESTGILSKGERVTIDALTTIANNRATAVKVVVKDQVPRSENEAIVVNVLTPAKSPAPDKEGMLEWTLTVPARSKQEVPLSFSVEYPKGMTVLGL